MSLGLVESFYEKFTEQYQKFQHDPHNWEFNNNGYRMMVYFKFGRIHTLLQQRAGLKDSYIFDYGIVKLKGEEDCQHVDNKQAFATEKIKSQMQFINFITQMIENFMSKDYDGTPFELK